MSISMVGLSGLKSSSVAGSGAVGSPTAQGTSGIGGKPTKEFSKVLDELTVDKTQAGGDIHAELMKVEKQVLNGGSFAPQELLRFQILAGRFGVAVELVTKVADGALQITKKFQQQQ